MAECAACALYLHSWSSGRRFWRGPLITGESEIGKSEAALELIKRGHRLVSDDVVELRRVSDVTLVGSRRILPGILLS